MGLITFEPLNLMDYSFENNLDIIEVEDNVTDLMSKLSESINQLLTVRDRIGSAKAVSRDDVLQLAEIADEFQPISAMLEEYHPSMFTQMPSEINLDVVVESMESSAFTSVVNAISSFVKFIVNAITSLFKWMWSSASNLFTKNKLDSANVEPLREFVKSTTEVVVKSSSNSKGDSNTNGLQGKFTRDSKRVYDTVTHNFFKNRKRLDLNALENPIGFSEEIGKVVNNLFAVELKGFLFEAQIVLDYIVTDVKVPAEKLKVLDNFILKNAMFRSFLQSNRISVPAVASPTSQALAMANAFKSHVKSLENETASGNFDYTFLRSKIDSYQSPVGLFDVVELSKDKVFSNTVAKIGTIEKVLNSKKGITNSNPNGNTTEEVLSILNQLSNLTAAFISINTAYASVFNSASRVNDGVIKVLANISDFIHKFLKENSNYLEIHEATQVRDMINRLNQRIKK